MLVQKYIVEGYEDPIHLGGHFKQYEIFVPQHNILIRLDNHKVVFVGESDIPRNKYHTSYSSKETIAHIEDININDKFISGCLEIFEQTKKINDLKTNLYTYFDETKSEEQQFEDKYKYYTDQFYDIIHSDEEKAIENFNNHLDNNIKEEHKSIYLRIARIYKAKQNEELFKKYMDKYKNFNEEEEAC